jgi:lysyl-tRNA synthetase class 2
MRLVEVLVAGMAQAAVGTTRVQWQPRASVEPELLEFAPPWRRISLRQALIDNAGVDYRGYPRDEDLLAAARDRGVPAERTWSRGKVLDELVTAFVEPRLIQPTFLLDYPVEFPGSTLAKHKPDCPAEVERWEAFAGGMEIANAFSELNDPMEQRIRFEEQVRLRAAGDEEAQPYDEDFVEALEYGMPPTGGVGLGIDRVVMLLAGQSSIRDVILFPQMRARQD